MSKNKDTQLIWESYMTEQTPELAPQQAPSVDPAQTSSVDPAAAEQPVETQPEPAAGDYAGYKMIVGQANVNKVAAMMMAINKGKTPSADQLAAYKPAFDLVDNIVKGGYPVLQKIHQILGLDPPAMSGPR